VTISIERIVASAVWIVCQNFYCGMGVPLQV
jgi:hypothetical protein